jgi:hypothetical protein
MIDRLIDAALYIHLVVPKGHRTATMTITGISVSEETKLMIALDVVCFGLHEYWMNYLLIQQNQEYMLRQTVDHACTT